MARSATRKRSRPVAASSSVSAREEGETRGGVRRSTRERSAIHRFVAGPAHGDVHSFETARFHVVPPNGWHRFLWEMGCSALNTLKYHGELPPPVAPHSCWMLPSSDEMAVRIAEVQPQLAAAGWKTLTCDPALVHKLSNKQRLREHAEQIGMMDFMPVHYRSFDEACYPAVLKGSEGNHGKNVFIVRSREEAERVTPGLSDEWLLQELIPGSTEYSVSVLVQNGNLMDVIETRYEYDREVYVWPTVKELGRFSGGAVPPKLLKVMEMFLVGYSGVCNFNYKLRGGGTGAMCLFEINARVGADLACDVPRARARAFFEKLDTLGGPLPQKDTAAP